MSRVLIYGGSGALGKEVVNAFRKLNWVVTSIDFSKNDNASENILLSPQDNFKEHELKVLKKSSELLGESKFNAIVCVAGGWAGGNAQTDDLVEVVERMYAQSVQTSIISARVAAKYLKENGLLVLTGAKAALEGTPGMVGYGMAKAAVIQLGKSLSSPSSGIQGKVVTLLPITLDTPANRNAMPNADFSSWTTLDSLSSNIVSWSSDPSSVSNGAYEVITSRNITSFNIIGSK